MKGNPTLPSKLKKNYQITKKSSRDYEVVVCINVGKLIATALAVIEEGHATYALGQLSRPQLRAHYSKIDVGLGSYLREYERLHTETVLEDMGKHGIDVTPKTVRFYQDTLELKFPTKLNTVEKTLVEFLRAKGFTVQKANEPLHIRHLERMRHRTGFIINSEVEYD